MSLPSGYKQYDYIQTSGTQILNTGFSFPNMSAQAHEETNRLILDIALIDTGSLSNQNAIKSNGSGCGYGSDVELVFNVSDDKYYITQSANSAVMSAVDPTERNTITIYELRYAYSQGTIYAICGDNEYTISAALNGSGPIEIGNNASLKIYGVKWQDPDGETDYYNFVPAMRTSDNVVGFYETVNGVFYINSGTGTFIAGNDVTVLAVNDSSLISVANAIRSKGGTSALLEFPTEFVSAIAALPTSKHGLPSGYTEMQYLMTYTSGAVYNTGIIPTANHYIKLHFNDVKYESGKNILGTSAGGYENCALRYQSNKWRIGFSGTISECGDWSAGAKYFELNKGSNNDAVINGTTVGSGACTSSSALLLGQAGPYANMGSTITHRLQVTDKTTDELVLDWIPAIRNSDNAIGFYDLVSETFFANSGGGSVIAGPIVE